MSIVDKNIFVLTGAGISRESGIKTFREKDGLWDNYRIEDVCTTEAFQKNPDFVNNFYNDPVYDFNIFGSGIMDNIDAQWNLFQNAGDVFYVATNY